MIKRRQGSCRSIALSLALILLGFVLLLDTLHLAGNMPVITLAGLFGLAALFGFHHYYQHHNRWWIVIPSSVLLGLAGVLSLDALWVFRRFDEGSFMIFAIALGFWLIYITQDKHWWAGIPAGILTTLALMIALDSAVYGVDFVGAFLMIGFGLTFGMLWLRRGSDGTGWAIWPAIVLAGIGFFIPIAGHLDLLWPLGLITAGLWLIRRELAQSGKMNKVKVAPQVNGASPSVAQAEIESRGEIRDL